MIETHIIPAVGRIPLAALQPLHLQEFYRQVRESGRVDGTGGLSARSIVLIHTVIHAALKQAVKWRMISQNPADAVDVPRPRRSTMKALDAEGINVTFKKAPRAKGKRAEQIPMALSSAESEPEE